MENARINLAPLRFGAGLKGKLLDAMRYGTPSVTTKIGAEGMHDGLDFNGSIANTATALAETAIALYNDKSSWLKAQANGTVIIKTAFEKQRLIKKLKIELGSIQENLEEHRTKNFMGQMLFQQTMASTKYMSKWIEEKNRA